MVNCCAADDIGQRIISMSNKKNRQGSTPNAMSKQTAINEATARVGPLVEIDKGRWSYHVWSTTENDWIPALRADGYGEARSRSSAWPTVKTTLDLLAPESAGFLTACTELSIRTSNHARFQSIQGCATLINLLP